MPDYDDEEDECLGRSASEELGPEDTKEVEEAIAEQETKAVLCSKLVVLFVLVCSALGVAYTTYSYVAGSETSQFENKFRDDSHKILDSVGTSLGKMLGLFDSLSVTMVASAHSSGEKWPFVTLSYFGNRLSKILPLSDTVSINVFPLVSARDRLQWEAYSVSHDSWVRESMKVQEKWNGYNGPVIYSWEPMAAIYGDSGDIPYNETRDFLPLWQNFPAIPSAYAPYNWDLLSVSDPASSLSCMTTSQAVVSEAYMIPTPDDPIAQAETEAWAAWFQGYIFPGEEPIEPVSTLFYPIIDDLSQVELADQNYSVIETPIVGVLSADFYWRELLRNVLPDDSNGIDVVFTNPCTVAFTYRIRGPQAVYRGVGDNHEPRFEHLSTSMTLSEARLNSSHATEYSGVPLSTNYCQFSVHVYASAEVSAYHTTNGRVIFTICAVAIFAFTSVVFCFYDFTVERRQKIVLKTAVRSTAIVSSLFPEDVRNRMYEEGDHKQANTKGSFFASGQTECKTEHAALLESEPIANVYPETTVLFADIVGFTSWSSQRQPTQVFRLLEMIYYSFDVIAKQRGVFKVETIGDSYVAVVGLPTPREQHAVIMARFARDIRLKMAEVVRGLEKSLGPGTAELALRIGLNSGPTTAGVLRGEKSRFQLFGDTVNTAARMESNGERNKIQVSQKTADLITASGKGHWLTPRSDKVNAKGKGMMQTYWMEPNSIGGSSAAESSEGDDCDEAADATLDDQTCRLVDWHVDIFLGVIRKVNDQRSQGQEVKESTLSADTMDGAMPRDQVAAIRIPQNVAPVANLNIERPLCAKIVEQLRELIESVANCFIPNDYHCFAHSSHVVMTTKKLLDKLISQAESPLELNSLVTGVLTNPLTQLAILFGALVHDIKHPGVSNAQQVKAQTSMSVVYNEKSLAEQNSFTVAWGLLMEPKFGGLRACIFGSSDDLERFRQILVNVLMATDLLDADLQTTRETCWQRASWAQDASLSLHDAELAGCRVTSIIDLVAQVADVSHTMQHFSIYKQWNIRLWTEMRSAYQRGCTNKNPTTLWYEDELAHFDKYVIPLAQKLQTCGMFGSLSDEFVGKATDNRMEWEMTGREIVQDMTLKQFGEHLGI